MTRLAICLSSAAILLMAGHARLSAQARGDAFAWATVEMKAGRFAEALPALEQYLRVNPGHLSARNNLAVCLIKLRRFQEAETHLLQVLKEAPKRGGAHLNRGVAAYGLNRPVEAATETDTAIQLVAEFGGAQETRAAALFNRAWLLDEQGELRRAVETYRLALEVRPAYARALVGLGVALAKLGQVREAFEALEQAQTHQGADAKIAELVALNTKAILEMAPQMAQRAPTATPSTPQARILRVLDAGWVHHTGFLRWFPEITWVLWFALQFLAFVVTVNVCRFVLARHHPFSAFVVTLVVTFGIAAALCWFLWGSEYWRLTLGVSAALGLWGAILYFR